MKILVLTTLYPNSEQSRHGIFIENRVLQLKKDYPDCDIQIMAPVPWFPFTSEKFGSYGKYPNIPKMEKRGGLIVHHPRYLVIPKIGMTLAPFLMAASLITPLKKLLKNEFDFDIIDTHYFYPEYYSTFLNNDSIVKSPFAEKIEMGFKASADINRTLYFYRGEELQIEALNIPNYHAVQLKSDEDISLKSGDEPCSILILQGKPIGEPVVQHGPFVMNTQEEIREAMKDYGKTQFGGWPWPDTDQVHKEATGRFAKHADGRVETK